MNNLANNKLVLVVALLVIVFSFVVAPFVVIWSLNTLFPVLAIDYTWQTWLAVSALFAIVHMLFANKISHSHG